MDPGSSLYPQFSHHNRDCSWILRRAQSTNYDSSDRSWISISLDVFEMASNNYAKIEIYNLETMELVFQIDQDLETSRQLNFYHDIRNAYAFLKYENSLTR